MSEHIVGINPERDNRQLGDGTWETEAQARETFLKDVLELLDFSERRILFVKRKPVFETVWVSNEDVARYRMLAQFEVIELEKPKSNQGK